MFTSHHELCIINQIDRENQSPQRRINQRHYFGMNENHYDPKYHQNNNGNHQNTAHHREIVFSLESKQGESQANGRRDAHRQNHLFRLVVGRAYGQYERFRNREDEKENEVHGGFSAHLAAASYDYHRDENHHEGDDQKLGMMLDPSSCRLVVQKPGDEAQRNG